MPPLAVFLVPGCICSWSQSLMAFSGDEFRYINRTSVEGKLDASNPISVYHETGVCVYVCVNAHLTIFLNLPSYGIWCVILRHSHTICPLRCCSPILSLSLSLSLENKGNFSEEILLRKREFGALSPCCCCFKRLRLR